MTNVLAIDPGGTTGLAVRLQAPKKDDEYLTFMLSAKEVMPWINETDSFDVVVIEFFATGGMLSRYGLETIDLVGQVKGWCLAKAIPCFAQSPSSRKAWKKEALEFPSKERKVIHEVDALAHLLRYLYEHEGKTAIS